jgi:hypothetical protein
MNLEELIAESQMRVHGVATSDSALWLASEFTRACQDGQEIPRWALELRALASRVYRQNDRIRKLEAAND